MALFPREVCALFCNEIILKMRPLSCNNSFTCQGKTKPFMILYRGVRSSYLFIQDASAMLQQSDSNKRGCLYNNVHLALFSNRFLRQIF